MRTGCGMNADLQNWIPRLVRALVDVRFYERGTELGFHRGPGSSRVVLMLYRAI